MTAGPGPQLWPWNVNRYGVTQSGGSGRNPTSRKHAGSSAGTGETPPEKGEQSGAHRKGTEQTPRTYMGEGGLKMVLFFNCL